MIEYKTDMNITTYKKTKHDETQNMDINKIEKYKKT